MCEKCTFPPIESRTLPVRHCDRLKRIQVTPQRDDRVSAAARLASFAPQPLPAQVRKIGEEYFTYLVDCEDPKVRTASVSAASSAPRRRRTVESLVR